MGLDVPQVGLLDVLDRLRGLDGVAIHHLVALVVLLDVDLLRLRVVVLAVPLVMLLAVGLQSPLNHMGPLLLMPIVLPIKQLKLRLR
jgi:hypothetical protein